MRQIAGVVFDVDDTLYLERDYVQSGFEAVGSWIEAELGVSGVGDVAWRLFEQGVRRTTLTDALEHRGVETTEDLRQAVVRVYRRHNPSIRLSDDAARLLKRLGGRIPLAVVTDGPVESQRAKCRALGLEKWVDTIVVTAEHGSSKPDPAMFTLAVTGWDVPAAQLAYVADNPAKDFDGPRSLGWCSFRVRRPGSLQVGLESPPDVAEIASLEDMALGRELGLTEESP
ncbi:MAG: HAD family hydrolase [Nocardioides sp.]|uniref:HAD family hydrolase n=1 Tax=Nocardioides sp. TaxID=35761 RepID=UPI0039E706F4